VFLLLHLVVVVVVVVVRINGLWAKQPETTE
jgi:hypothetical protein